MANPTVTVLIDTYNHERFIEEAIVSVLEQDFPAAEMEILVVDDGSTDRTPEIVQKFAPRVRYLRKENGGQASAFNFGIPQAQGDIIAFLDGDDWWAHNKLDRVVEAMSRNPGVGMVGHAIIESSSGGERVIAAEILEPLRLDSLLAARIFRLYRCYFGTSRLTLRSAIAKSIVPVPQALIFEADEYLFTVAAALTPFIVLKDPLTYYRIHSESLFLAAGSSSSGLRRKQFVLEALATSLARDLPHKCAPEAVVECILEIVNAEALQLRLMLDGGRPSETYRTESTIYRVMHGEVSLPQKLFRQVSLIPACVLPPKWFYRARRWLSSQNWYIRARRSVLPVPPISQMENIKGSIE